MHKILMSYDSRAASTPTRLVHGLIGVTVHGGMDGSSGGNCRNKECFLVIFFSTRVIDRFVASPFAIFGGCMDT